MVEAIYPYLARSPGRCRGSQPQISTARRIHPSIGAGIYSYLFLGQRSINKIQAIVREEMDRIGQEFLLPALHPRELWEESGRWTIMGQNLFKLQDRKGAWLVLGMTDEEVMTDIARKELRSYKQLPQIWYQIQTKFRDEPRPRAGLLRVRQFIMKDSYSFDLDEAGLDVSYKKHDAAYRAIFTRSGLNFVAVQADSGAMGGSQSQEFMVYAEAGEDLIASCPACNYAANIEKATSLLPPVEDLPWRRRPGTGAHPGTAHHRSSRRVPSAGAGSPGQDHGIHGVDPGGQSRRGGSGQSRSWSCCAATTHSTRPNWPDCFRPPGSSGPWWRRRF